MTFALLCGAGILWSAQSATIFSDNFSNATQSNINWIWLGNNTTMTVSNGTAVLKNADTVYTGFLIHTLSPKPSKFTLSVDFSTSAPVNGVGFMFCLSTSSSLSGYTVQLGGTQNIFAYKYAAGAGTLLIPNKTSSFINPLTNTMTVSKSADTFNIFANGHYVTRFNNTQFSGGDLSVVVPPKSQVTVDNVLMTDQFIQGNPSTCFADSFQATDLESSGWNVNPLMGQATDGAGKCVLNDTSNTISSIIFTDGNFQSASIEAAVGHTRGAGMYGVCFISAVAGDSGRIDYKPYAFLVDSMRQYSIVYPDSPNVRTRSAKSFIYGSLGTDTLEVIRYANHFVFKVNRIDVGETIPVPSTYRIDGAGLYVSKKTAATYNYFTVGGDSTRAYCTPASPVINRSILTRTTVRRFGGGSFVYDIQGRKIGVLDKLTFNKLPNGPYIIVMKGNNGALVKAMRVMKPPK